MKVLFLRPEGSEIPSSVNFINLSILKPVCIPYRIEFDKIDGIGFTSVNAVKCFNDFKKIENKLVFAVGETTAKVLQNEGLTNILVPDDYTVDNLVTLIKKKSKNPLLVRSKIAINKDLDVLQVADYDLVVNENKLNEARELIEKCKVNIVVLTSSFIAKLVKDYIKDCIIIVSIGPSTSKTLNDKKNIYEAKEHDMKGILKLLEELGAYHG